MNTELASDGFELNRRRRFFTSPRSRGEVGSHRRCDPGEGDSQQFSLERLPLPACGVETSEALLEGWVRGTLDGLSWLRVPLTRNSRCARISTSPRKQGE